MIYTQKEDRSLFFITSHSNTLYSQRTLTFNLILQPLEGVLWVFIIDVLFSFTLLFWLLLLYLSINLVEQWGVLRQHAWASDDNLRSHLYPPTVWALGIELRLSDLAANVS